MNRIPMLALASSFVFLQMKAATDDVIRTAADLHAATSSRTEVGRRFDVTVRLTTECRAGDVTSFAVEDDTGAIQLWKAHVPWSDKVFPAGTRARAQGIVSAGRRSRHCYAKCLALDFLSAGPAPEPTPVTAGEFLSGKYDCRLVTIRGTVRDIVADEIDPHYAYVIVQLDGETIAVPFSRKYPALRQMSIGTEIEVSGICSPTILGVRRQIGRTLSPQGDTVKILSNAAKDSFDAPPVQDFPYLRPQDVAALGRHKAKGRVVATWHGDSALVMMDGDRITRIETDVGNAPSYGDFIEAIGFPESDLYHINLNRAIWRRIPAAEMKDEEPQDVTIEAMQTGDDGYRCFDPALHGHAVRIHGTVLSLSDSVNGSGRFTIESGSHVVSVDASSTPEALNGLEVGCRISVSGTCVMESDNWRPNLPFPVIRGFFVTVRRPSDITILSHPSYWTPPRLMAIVAVLLLVLLGSLLWNALLTRRAEHRGRELAKAAIAKAEADLKVEERTRLAVELHDSISQNLTGISLALHAAERLLDSDAEGTRKNLNLAAVSLDSCRQELKNCIWDLRNNTLDTADMTTAIYQTLAPHLGESELSVRFNVPRSSFSDKTAHAILHIIRELAVNAVRHGHASHVHVEGGIENDGLRFSVCDDGCGFDPETCPDMTHGHFGLQGVRERVNQMEGTIAFASRKNGGTRVVISIKAGGCNT